MVRAMLATFKIIIGNDLPSGLDIRQFWCYTYQYANFVLRRTYNSTRKAIPYTLVHSGRKSSFRELVLFGAICTTVHTKKNNKSKLDPQRSLRTYFMGYGNHEHMHLIYDLQSQNKSQCHVIQLLKRYSLFQRLKNYFRHQSSIVMVKILCIIRPKLKYIMNCNYLSLLRHQVLSRVNKFEFLNSHWIHYPH